MGLFENLGRKIDDLFAPPEEIEKRELKEIGDTFERYVIDLILSNNTPSKTYFEIVDWTRDIDKDTTGIQVTSNMNPDLLIRYIPTGDLFAVECKYRSNFIEKDNRVILKWSYRDQISRYLSYQNEHAIPVFVVIGVGSRDKNYLDPRNPEYMFCFLLESCPYPEIFESKLPQIERSPDKKFFWDYHNKMLK